MAKKVAVTVFGLACLALGGGCSSGPSDDDPVGALVMFLDAMKRSEWDDAALEDAYNLLDERAREALTERAQLANALSGREFEPWEMLAQGRYHLRFSPRRSGMEARIEGDSAYVVVTGAREGEHAEVPMVREADGWRLVLELPPMRRDNGTGP